MKLAIVGCTGLVGREILNVLNEIKIDYKELIFCASQNSAGKKITYNGESYTIITPDQAIILKPDFAIFSAGSDVSLKYAPLFAEIGCVVVDNSSAWRMHPDVPLVVPEINIDSVKSSKIIANPNCSTIQLVMVIAPLHKKYKIKRMIVSTYQAVTGTGKEAVDQMMAERNKEEVKMKYPYEIDLNCIPQCDVFLENGYTKEEMKIVNETRKILGDSSLKITSTAVRVPVIGGHSESVNLEFENDYDLKELKSILANTEGVVVQDNPETLTYPMPKFAQGKNDVFVGRLRRDDSTENALNFWVVADNLRKGAATNAVQIVKALIKNN